MVKFNANLSSKSLEALIKDFNIYGENLLKAQKDILEALANYVYERIMFYVPVDTGTLKASFVKDISNDIARVYTDLYYAKFVEFGTGIHGRESNYDLSKTDIQKLTYTRTYPETYTGQVAQKFIYRAVLDLEQNYVEVAKNVLREKGLI